MHVVKSPQRQQQLFQTVAAEQLAVVLEDVLSHSFCSCVLPNHSLEDEQQQHLLQAGSRQRAPLAAWWLPLQPGEPPVGTKGCTLPHEKPLLPLTLWLVLLLAVLHGQVYRFCTLEGTWLLKENSTLPWRNLSECEASDQVRVSISFCCVCLGQNRKKKNIVFDVHTFLFCQSNLYQLILGVLLQ